LLERNSQLVTRRSMMSAASRAKSVRANRGLRGVIAPHKM
jgi:hypothetical protein